MERWYGDMRTRINNEDVSNKTYFNREYVYDILTRAERIAEDTERVARLKVMECVVCHLAKRIGGAAMTGVNCRVCDVDMRFSSTATDQTCLPCAVEHHLCRHCGGDIDMKLRRVKREFKTPASEVTP